MIRETDMADITDDISVVVIAATRPVLSSEITQGLHLSNNLDVPKFST